MADKANVFGAIEDGTYSTTAPNPHVNLAGTMPSGNFIRQTFANAASDGWTLTITVRKDEDNWVIYSGATFTTGSPNILDLSTGTLISSAGSISNGDTVIAIVDMPMEVPDPTGATQGAIPAVDANGDYELIG